jgi:hypothetical protein
VNVVSEVITRANHILPKVSMLLPMDDGVLNDPVALLAYQQQVVKEIADAMGVDASEITMQQRLERRRRMQTTAVTFEMIITGGTRTAIDVLQDFEAQLSNSGSALRTSPTAGAIDPATPLQFSFACKDGMYRGTGDADCTSCAAGSAPDSSQSFCLPCSPGTAGMNGVCATCIPSKQPDNEKARCELCPSGKSSSDGVLCVLCQPGQYSNPGSVRCEDCQAGQNDHDSSPTTPCIDCDSGKRSTAAAAVFCDPCPIGSTSISTSKLHPECVLYCRPSFHSQRLWQQLHVKSARPVKMITTRHQQRHVKIVNQADTREMWGLYRAKNAAVAPPVSRQVSFSELAFAASELLTHNICHNS